MNIAIIGGGISGLTTAFYIKQFKPEAKITLFEKEDYLGGKMHTVNKNGFLIEEGSNGFLSNKPDTLELVKLSGLENLLLRSSDNARKRYIFHKSLEILPESAMAFIKTPLLSIKGKLRVLGEIVAPAKKDDSDESLQDFGYRRVGKEMTDVFLDAMVAGIYASTPEKISAPAAFPAVVKLEREYGSLFKGMIAKKKKEAGPGGILMSFKGGVSTFIEQLETKIDMKIIKNKEIQEVQKNENGFKVISDELEMDFDKVILCSSAYDSAKMLQNLSPIISKKLFEIEYSPVSIIGLGYDALEHDLNGFGLLTTSKAKKEILGILWDSSIFFDRAKKGKKLLRVMIGGQRNPNLALKNEDELIKIAINGVKEIMNIDIKPNVVYVKKHVKAIPNYKVGHLANIKIIFDKLKDINGLFLNSNAYHGVGLNDCVSNSKKCAKTVIGIE